MPHQDQDRRSLGFLKRSSTMEGKLSHYENILKLKDLPYLGKFGQ